LKIKILSLKAIEVMSFRYALARTHKPSIASNKSVSTIEENENVKHFIEMIKPKMDEQQHSQKDDNVKRKSLFGRLWNKIFGKKTIKRSNPDIEVNGNKANEKESLD
jgi:hypothetical protein